MKHSYVTATITLSFKKQRTSETKEFKTNNLYSLFFFSLLHPSY